MKKVYRFNLIPGVEFVEKDGFYYAASDDPIWPKSHTTKVIIDGLLEYESNNSTLYERLEFTKKVVENRDKTIEEKDKEIEELTKKLKNAERNISYLDDKIEYLRKCGGEEINHRNNIINEKDKEIEELVKKLKNAENEIDHRNKLLEENDESIEYIRVKLHEEIMKSEAYKETIKTLDEENSKLNKQIIQNPISKGPIPLSFAEDCSDFYICTPDHITYGYIAGEFGIGLYVDDTLILLKGDKASEAVYERRAMIDKINTLEETLKKKDEMIEELEEDIELKIRMCTSYIRITDKLNNIINDNNSEIKVLSDQVTRLMDQLKEVMGETPVCDDIKPCRLTPEMVAEFEQRVKTEAKPETNFDKIMADTHNKLTPERLAQIIKTSGCQGVHCDDCPFNTIAKPYGLSLCDMPHHELAYWLSEDIKED